MIRSLIIGLLLTLCIGVQASAKTLVFSAIPDQDESRLNARFGKIAHYLSTQLDIEVKYIPVKNYAAAVAAFRNNQIQLAWFGGLSGVRARRLVPNSEAIAQGYEDQFFKTYIIAHHSTGLVKGDAFPSTMTGMTFTFGSKSSTSGRLIPEYYIRQYMGKAPQAVFKRVGFSGDHNRTIALVQSGVYQVGAVNFKVWENALKSKLIDTRKVKVIWETPTFPDYQWTIRGDVDQYWGKNFKQKVQQALLKMQDPDLLASFPRTSFIKADNSLYKPIATTAVAIGLLDQ